MEGFLPHLHKGIGERGFSLMYSVNSYLHTALETAAGTSKEKDNEPFFSYPVLARVGKMKYVAMQSYLVCPLWKSCMDEEKGHKNHCTFITMCMKKERDEVFFFFVPEVPWLSP